MAVELEELDSVEILAIVDNELDPLSPCPNQTVVHQEGGVRDISLRAPVSKGDVRGDQVCEFRMDDICCSAHGLSLLITGHKGGKSRTILFDAGPSESSWQRNVLRLGCDLAKVELIQLSHWHRDHSGGMLKAIEMITRAQTRIAFPQGPAVSAVRVDLHPDRPDYRGFQAQGMPVVSLEADPTIEEMENAGAVVELSDRTHTVLDNMFVISGSIPRVTDYETGFKNGVAFNYETGKWEPDELIMDERLLACKLKDQGLVVFTGCSHAGIVNTSRHALELAAGSRLHAVVGGFHLVDSQAEKLQAAVRDLKALEPNVLIAGHCTGWRAKFEIERQIPGCLVPCFVGSKYVL